VNVTNEQPTNSNILTARPPKNSFIVGSWDDEENFYAAVPCGNGLAIIHKSITIKICRNTISAKRFIEKHKKSKK
tara:strand:+ start:451 stop:675 length:225 start_codon:yes stop_codon:yes gene_type:complete